MGKIKRYKNVIERFLSGEKGQRFFNIAYSIGAAIVILGALFKILHYSGGDLLLSIGMSTEVLMFILTAFDRPPREANWEEILPVIAGTGKANTLSEGESVGTENKVTSSPAASAVSDASVRTAGGTIIVTGGGGSTASAAMPAAVSSEVAEQIDRLGKTAAELNAAGEALLKSYRSLAGDGAMSAESAGLGAASYMEQMQALNRNIAGLNTIYEIQLRSVSSQLDAIESVNRGMSQMKNMYEQTAECSEAYREEAQKLTRNMQHLNKVYEQMLNAMTVNMFHASPAGEAR
ncbi:MAG: gliding motility protein GldL [Paramuribaculum sp.]|nr:gliding motility protein GldL [Paramuribaculum sp.]